LRSVYICCLAARGTSLNVERSYRGTSSVSSDAPQRRNQSTGAYDRGRSVPRESEPPDQRRDRRRDAALEAPRRAHAKLHAHQECEIGGAGMQEDPLQDVAVPPEMHPTHAPGFIEMGKWPLKAFPSLSQQPLPARAANPSAIPIHGVARLEIALPLAPLPLRFRQIRADLEFFEIFQRLIAVVALIADHLLDAVALRVDGLDLLHRHDQGVAEGRRIAVVRVLHGHATAGPAPRATACSRLWGRRGRAIFHLRVFRA